MAKLAIKKASTDVTVYLFIQASNVTTGAGLTGLTFETASLVASYVRPLAARAAITLATQTMDGAHSDGGFVEVDATNMPGVYRLDLPDAVCAAGVNSVVVMLKGAANMSPVVLEIQLTTFDLNTDIIGADSDTLETLSNQLDATALEATLTAIKGAGWTTETLKTIYTVLSGDIQDVKDVVDVIAIDTTTEIPASIVALDAVLTAIKGAGWTTQTLVAMMTAWQAANVTSGVTNGLITQVRGDSWDFDIDPVTLDSNKQQFCIKEKTTDLDSESILFMDNVTGLLYLNGAVATASDATMTYTGTKLNIKLNAEASAQLPVGKFHYGAQYKTAAGIVKEPYGGTFTISSDLVFATE